MDYSNVTAKFKARKDTIGYGIDLGSKYTKTAVVEKQGENLVLVDFDIRETPTNAIVNGLVVDRDAIIDFLQTIKQEVELPKNSINIAIPNRFSGKSLKVDIPFMEDQKKEKSLILNKLTENEASRKLIENSYFDYIFNRKEGFRKHLNVYEVKKNILEDYCSLFLEAGINPKTVDLDQLALIRSILGGLYHKGDISPLESETVMVVEFGHQNTNVIIIKKGVPETIANIAKGGENLTQAIVHNTGLTIKEAEKAKVQNISVEQYYTPLLIDILKDIVNIFTEFNEIARRTIGVQGQIERIFVTGGGSGFASLVGSMNKTFNKVTKYGEPFGLKIEQIHQWEQKKVYGNVAIGLAGQFFYC